MWPVSPKKKPSPAGGETEQAPVERIAQAILHQAIRENAAAVQLDAYDSETISGLRVQYLVEGVWRETMMIPKQIEPALIAHFKALAGLPTQYRMALQGLILLHRGEQPGISDPLDRDYDIAIEIVPTRQGEKITLRIEAAEKSQALPPE